MTLDTEKFAQRLAAEKERLEKELSGVSVHANPKNPNDWEATYEAPSEISEGRNSEIDPFDVAETISTYEKGFF